MMMIKPRGRKLLRV